MARCDHDSLLLTDLYQLTMLDGYRQAGMEQEACFEFFFRSLSAERNFLLAAGLESVLDFVEQARFTAEELDWLAGLRRFAPDFIDYLAHWRFGGAIHAVPEGTVVFAQEPVLRVTAPLPQAQLLESRLINLLHFQTLIASKAARSVLAAPDKLLVDFGLRRAHGSEAGLLSARSAYLAGFAGSATVLAGRRYQVPLFGTMAHSYIQAHRDELAAFRSFAKAQPDNLVFLIDTYDTEQGAATLVRLAPELRDSGLTIKAVRLDSGNLAQHARRVRAILDAGGLPQVSIFASGDLDERALQDLLAAGAPIDGFGVGTRLDCSADRPYLDCAYKLTEYGGRPRRKRSEGKLSWPGRRQLWRRYAAGGEMAGDTVALEGEPAAGEPLLQPVMAAGRRLTRPEPLAVSRERAAFELSRLPAGRRGLAPAPAPYPVELSMGVLRLAETADAEAAAARGSARSRGSAR